ncbi:MAG: PLP-dependent transferase [Planctomycetota bacterium]|nr:MAG: PLP-dependent transferase [Planctomycetota bacterium]
MATRKGKSTSASKTVQKEAAEVPKPPRGYSTDAFLMYGRQKTRHWDYQHHVVPPLSASSTFRLESHQRGEAGFCGFADPELTRPTKPHIFIYERLDEPVRAMLEERLAAAEGAEMGVCFASGMAAISAAVAHRLKAGDEVVAHPTLYGCTYSLFTNWLPRYGVKVRYQDLTQAPSRLRIGKKTRIVYCETPANPTLQIVDMEAIAARIAKANEGRSQEEKCEFVVDNTFATPACQRPLEHGVDVVCGSLTKGLSGFGTDMGGYVATSESDESSLLVFRKDFGSPLSPTPAWRILNFGLPTLSLRVKQAQASAFELADYLHEHPKVARVQYPGHPASKGYETARRQMHDFHGEFAPGTLIYFEVKGRNDKEAAARADQLVDTIGKKAYVITLAVSLGQIRTLIERPGGMTHSMLPEEVAQTCGIGAGGVRLAVGIENPDDIRRDLEKALKSLD